MLKLLYVFFWVFPWRQSDAGEIPKRIHTIFKTRRKLKSRMLKLVISIMLHALRTCVLLPNQTLLYLPRYSVVVTVLYMYPDGGLQLKTKHSHVTVHFTLVEGFVSDCPAVLLVS
jgi:hypothetical protein